MNEMQFDDLRVAYRDYRAAESALFNVCSTSAVEGGEFRPQWRYQEARNRVEVTKDRIVTLVRAIVEQMP